MGVIDDHEIKFLIKLSDRLIPEGKE